MGRKYTPKRKVSFYAKKPIKRKVCFKTKDGRNVCFKARKPTKVKVSFYTKRKRK